MKKILNSAVPFLGFLVLIFFGLISFFYGVYMDDWRLALTRDADGYYTVKVLALMLESHNFISPHAYFISYGTLYYYLSVSVLFWRDLFGKGQDLLDIYASMRFVSFSFGFASLLLLPWLARLFSLPRYFPYLATVVFLTLHSFFRYLFFPKPETLLLFFSLLIIAMIAKVREQGKIIHLLVGAVACALAAAAKVPGIFWAPFVVLADVCFLWENRKGRALVQDVLLRSLLFSGVCLGLYLILNLRWIVDFDFSIGFFEAAQKGSWRTEEPQFWTWGWSREFLSLGYFFIASAVGGIGLLGWRKCRFPFDVRTIDARAIVALFPVALFFYYSLHLHKGFTQRYLLIAVFPLMLTAFYFWQEVFQWFREKSGSFSLSKARGVALVVALLALTDMSRVKDGANIIHEFATYARSPVVKMGHYLSENYPREAKIAYYFYTWVPAQFMQTQLFEGGQLELIDLINPDLVVVMLGNDRNETFIREADEGRAPYVQVKQFDQVALYQRRDMAKPAGE